MGCRKGAAIFSAYFKLSHQHTRYRLSGLFQLERIFVLLIIKFARTCTEDTIRVSSRTFILSLTADKTIQECYGEGGLIFEDGTGTNLSKWWWCELLLVIKCVELLLPQQMHAQKLGFFPIESQPLTRLTVHPGKKCETVVNNDILCKYETKKLGWSASRTVCERLGKLKTQKYGHALCMDDIKFLLEHQKFYTLLGCDAIIFCCIDTSVMRWWTSGFHKMLGSSRVAAQLAASQEGLSSMSEWDTSVKETCCLHLQCGKWWLQVPPKRW
jgi:hypothetical protein